MTYYWSHDPNGNAIVYTNEGVEITWCKKGKFSSDMLDAIIAMFNYDRRNT